MAAPIASMDNLMCFFILFSAVRFVVVASTINLMAFDCESVVVASGKNILMEDMFYQNQDAIELFANKYK